jgi:1,4-alpha-glucan branching enzyme
MVDKMPGDMWQKHANLRALYGYMFVHPGKKLLFMGGEIGQWREWNHDWQVEWETLGDPRHAGLQRWVRDLNRVYAATASLWDADFDPHGFTWIDCNDHEHSIIALMRKAGHSASAAATAGQREFVIAVVNFTPVARYGYRLGVPAPGAYAELLNSDADVYGGSNVGNQGEVVAVAQPSHGHAYSLNLTVPPLGFVLLKPNK